jgi:hypothetical protein
MITECRIRTNTPPPPRTHHPRYQDPDAQNHSSERPSREAESHQTSQHPSPRIEPTGIPPRRRRGFLLRRRRRRRARQQSQRVCPSSENLRHHRHRPLPHITPTSSPRPSFHSPQPSLCNKPLSTPRHRNHNRIIRQPKQPKPHRWLRKTLHRTGLGVSESGSRFTHHISGYVGKEFERIFYAVCEFVGE